MKEQPIYLDYNATTRGSAEIVTKPLIEDV